MVRKEEYDALENKYTKLKKLYVNSVIEQDKKEQRSKMETIRIHNIPAPTLTPGNYENVGETVSKLLEDANITMPAEKFKTAFRPMKQGTRGSNIYCTFLRTSDKLKVLRSRKTNMTDNPTFQSRRSGIFITEDLTPLRQLIAYRLRQDKTRIHKSWSVDGKIKCIKVNAAPNDKPITIDSPHDLTEAGWTEEEIEKFIDENILHSD